jgi:hypothetical protein
VRREGLRLSRRHEAWLHGISAALFATGVLWLLFHYFVQVEGEFGASPHALEPWWLKLHGAAAMAFLVLLGTVARDHIPLGWRARRNRSSGAGLVSLVIVLVATGWALYYAGNDSIRGAAGLAHTGLGLGLPLALLVHARRGRATRHAARRPPARAAGPQQPTAESSPPVRAPGPEWGEEDRRAE